jgi:hypothetical protein
MHIIFDEAAKSELSDKHVVLELDTISVGGREFTAYCVVEHIPFQDIGRIGLLYDLHHQMMNCYKTRQWQKALDCLTGVQGQWGGRVDSFYEIMHARLQGLVDNEPDLDWKPTIDRTNAA